MKKTLLIAAAALIGASAFAADVVSSANVVGYSQVELAPGFSMIRVPFVDGTNSVNIQDALDPSVMAQGGSAVTADEILLWDNIGLQYTGYYLTDGSTKATTGKEGKWVDVAGNLATELLAPGTGFFISKFGSTATNILSGDVVDAATGTSSLELLEGFNLIANPFTSEWDLNSTNIDWVAEGAKSGGSAVTADEILLWDSVGLQYTGYYLTDGSTKATTGKDGKWVDTAGSLLTNNIGLNQGFFYSRTIGQATATIGIDQPYTLD